jgi:hypothetical protein
MHRCRAPRALRGVSGMVTDLCDHIVDIVANSLRAEAKHIGIFITEDFDRNRLNILIRDDGNGMDERTVRGVADPFFSTKMGKKIGLGVPLLKGTAEICNGEFDIKSFRGQGTEVSASFQLDHPDLPPLGNLKDTILVLLVSNPETDFAFRYSAGKKNFALDTKEMREPLGSVPLNHPKVIAFLRSYLEENL